MNKIPYLQGLICLPHFILQCVAYTTARINLNEKKKKKSTVALPILHLGNYLHSLLCSAFLYGKPQRKLLDEQRPPVQGKAALLPGRQCLQPQGSHHHCTSPCSHVALPAPDSPSPLVPSARQLCLLMLLPQNTPGRPRRKERHRAAPTAAKKSSLLIFYS